MGPETLWLMVYVFFIIILMFAEALINTRNGDLCLLGCSSRLWPPGVSRAALQILVVVNRGADLEKR